MKILVTVKRVIDPYVKIRVKADGQGVETQNVKMAINPFDEIALEQAVQWREKQIASEVVVVTIGQDEAQDTLRQALAKGADRAILLRSQASYCSLNVAKILQHLALQEQPQLVLMGKQAIDGDHNQTPQMLAALLDWPQATFASHMDFIDQQLIVTRETDHGLETLRLDLPAVVSADLRLNEPRYASLPNIMKAKQKPFSVLDVDSFNLDLKSHQQVISVKSPPGRQAGRIVGSVQELIHQLKNEAKVL